MANCFIGRAAYIKQSYQGTGIFSDGEIAQGCRGIVSCQCLLELCSEEKNKIETHGHLSYTVKKNMQTQDRVKQ